MITIISPVLKPYKQDVLFDFGNFFSDLDKVVAPRAHNQTDFQPACEVTEADEHFLMSLDLPGMKKENLNIEIEGNSLVVSGLRKREGGDSQKLHFYERNYGSFRRSFTLPPSVEASKIEARYENGVLDLYLPKAEKAKPQQIQIQGEKEGFWGKLIGKQA